MLEIRILGPVEVLRDGRALPLGGAKQRALVADLALHANEVVSADRLIDDLWGEEPPDTAAHMLHVYVSRLRKTLEDHGRMVLETRPPGYVLNLDPQDDLDAARFESHIREGRSALDARPAEALATFDEALGWWRGRALEEFAHESFAQPAAARLEELRQATHEGRVEALLSLGRHEEALGELEALIARFPLRERSRELQMLALYRSGRQGEALQAFQSARKTLAEELGVDPGPALVSLEQAILRHDAELDPPAREARSKTAEAGGTSTTRGRQRGWVAAVVTAALIGGLLIVVGVTELGEEPQSPPNDPAGNGTEGTIHWTEVPGPAGAFLGGSGDQVILGGTATPNGLMAVGYTAAERGSEGSRNYDAAVWIENPDGVWQLVDDAAFAAPGNQRATDSLAIEGRLVVVGFDQSPGDFDAAVWTLDDGSSSWSRVNPESRGMHQPGNQGLRAAAWTGSRVIAVGYTRRGGDEDAAMWTSTDARDWTPLLAPTNLEEPGHQQMSTVTTTSNGLTVVGGHSESSGDRNAAIWTSPDLLEWERLIDIDLEGEGQQQINAILVGGPGLVAVGQETVGDDQNAVVWTSVDGVEWERVEDLEGSLGGPGLQQMSAITVSEGMFVAAGTDEVENETDGAVWTSLDAMTWTRLPPTAIETADFTEAGRGEGVRDLLVDGDRIVALGREWRTGDDDADVWIGQLES
jgi:DNA-binding SARP family transcriptional activator